MKTKYTTLSEHKIYHTVGTMFEYELADFILFLWKSLYSLFFKPLCCCFYESISPFGPYSRLSYNIGSWRCLLHNFMVRLAYATFNWSACTKPWKWAVIYMYSRVSIYICLFFIDLSCCILELFRQCDYFY
jgi:hypothetical protein